jgi:hypothetical protein
LFVPSKLSLSTVKLSYMMNSISNSLLTLVSNQIICSFYDDYVVGSVNLGGNIYENSFA